MFILTMCVDDDINDNDEFLELTPDFVDYSGKDDDEDDHDVVECFDGNASDEYNR